MFHCKHLIHLSFQHNFIFISFPFTGEACKAVVDVAFLLDSSGSISRRNWKLLLDFLRDSIEAFDVTASGSHVASISYSSRAVVNFRFNTLTGDKLTSAELIKEVDKVKHQRGYTYIDRALLLADEEIFTERGGMRQAVRKVLSSYDYWYPVLDTTLGLFLITVITRVLQAWREKFGRVLKIKRKI